MQLTFDDALRANKLKLSTYHHLDCCNHYPYQLKFSMIFHVLHHSPTTITKKSVVFFIVDRLSKYAHFYPLSAVFTAVFVAKVFMKEIYHFHGLPTSITSDRDPVFLSNFWREFFKMKAMSLCHSSAYYPPNEWPNECA